MWAPCGRTSGVEADEVLDGAVDMEDVDGEVLGEAGAPGRVGDPAAVAMRSVSSAIEARPSPRPGRPKQRAPARRPQNVAIGLAGEPVPRAKRSGLSVKQNSQRPRSSQAAARRSRCALSISRRPIATRATWWTGIRVRL